MEIDFLCTMIIMTVTIMLMTIACAQCLFIACAQCLFIACAQCLFIHLFFELHSKFNIAQCLSRAFCLLYLLKFVCLWCFQVLNSSFVFNCSVNNWCSG